jgi:hypothetical protein
VQIEEIIAAAEHVDVPADELLAAAAEIRSVLLSATPLLEMRVPARRRDPVRRARILRTVLVAAALGLALLLTAAIGGALPDTIQSPIARVGNLIGLNLPAPDQPSAVDATSEPQPLPSEGVNVSRSGSGASNGPAGSRRDESPPASANAAVAIVADSPASAPKASDGIADPNAQRTDGAPQGREAGDGKGPPEHSGAGNGNGYANGPDQNNGNGNGPTDNNGTGPGNGNGGDTPNGNGNASDAQGDEIPMFG